MHPEGQSASVVTNEVPQSGTAKGVGAAGRGVAAM